MSTLIFPRFPPRSEILARIGLVLLSSDENGGEGFASIVPRSALQVLQTRIAFGYDGREFSEVTSFADMAATLPPAGRLDVLAFSCTSWAVQAGVDAFLKRLEGARPGIKYTTPPNAAVLALRTLHISRLSVLTPYELSLHLALPRFFDENGFRVASDGTFAATNGTENNEVSYESIAQAAQALVASGRPEALFICCTAMPVVPHIQRLEAELGIPVLTSTQVLAWHSLVLAGYADPIDGFGQLLAKGRQASTFTPSEG